MDDDGSGEVATMGIWPRRPCSHDPGFLVGGFRRKERRWGVTGLVSCFDPDEPRGTDHQFLTSAFGTSPGTESPLVLSCNEGIDFIGAGAE